MCDGIDWRPAEFLHCAFQAGIATRKGLNISSLESAPTICSRAKWLWLLIPQMWIQRFCMYLRRWKGWDYVAQLKCLPFGTIWVTIKKLARCKCDGFRLESSGFCIVGFNLDQAFPLEIIHTICRAKWLWKHISQMWTQRFCMYQRWKVRICCSADVARIQDHLGHP